jgi:single-stranded DNA-binding protein
VQLVGRVGAEPDVRFAGEGADRAWAKFSVATEAPYANSETPDWHAVIVRDRLAQFVTRHVTKGRLVHVVGWLTYRVVENRNGAQRIAEIHASSVQLLDRPIQRDELPGAG